MRSPFWTSEVGQHEAVPHDANNVMTNHQNISSPNTGEANSPTHAGTSPVTTGKARRQRIRGCGVPPTVWFAPHPDNHTHDRLEETTDRTGPDSPCESRREYREWAVAEMVRQFTGTGQHYAIIRAAVEDRRVPDGAITRRRRASDAGGLSDDGETSIRAGYDLVVLIGSEDEFPADNGDDDAYFEHLEWRDKGPGPDLLVSLIKGAKRMLADGGTLAVQVPRPRPGAGFSDDTGDVVKDARRAGFVYLQHIAVVDSFIDDEGLTPALPQADLDAFHAARADGLPIHARSHSDLLIFRKLSKENTLA